MHATPNVQNSDDLDYAGDYQRGRGKGTIRRVPAYPRLAALLAFVAALALVVSVAAMAAPVDATRVLSDERLRYTISYRGLFSLGIKLVIAQAELTTRNVEYLSDRQPTYLSMLNVTTAPYSKVELIYAFRYRYESWFSADLQRTQLASIWQKARRAEQDVIWFDWDTHLVRSYRWREGDDEIVSSAKVEADGRSGGEVVLPSRLLQQGFASGVDMQRFRYAGKAALPQSAHGLDYMAMLQSVRFSDLRSGKLYKLPVFNGAALTGFWVTVEDKEALAHGTIVLPAFKLRFDPIYADDSDKSGTRVYVWISADLQRLPLRFFSETRYGAMTAELQP